MLKKKLAEGTAVLDAARQLGVEIESICGGRLTCNKCRIRVEERSFAKHDIPIQSSERAKKEKALWTQISNQAVVWNVF